MIQAQTESPLYEAPARPQLGELLIARKIITPEQLKQALEHQTQRGHKRLLGEVLVELPSATVQHYNLSTAEC